MYKDVESVQIELKYFKHINKRKLDHFPNLKTVVEETGIKFV